MESRKRDRIAKACATCRRKKTKCNGETPCALCSTHNLPCIYESSRARKPRSSSNNKLSNRLSNLEDLVTRLVQKLEPLTGNIPAHNGSSQVAYKSKGSDSDANYESPVDEDSMSDSGTIGPETARITSASNTDMPAAKNSIFEEYKSLLDIAQGSSTRDVKCEHKFVIASQYKGPQLGFSILLSEQSINYVKSKLAPEDHRLLIPMQTLPVYMMTSKRAFLKIWREPQVQTAESIAKLKAGCFPEKSFIEEILQLYSKLHFANFICDVDYVRGLFDLYHTNKKRAKPNAPFLSYSELMIMCLVLIICVSAYVDEKNSLSAGTKIYPSLSKLSLNELVNCQESLFKNAVFYYHRICTVSEGLATIQALILMAVHLETSWVISDLNFSLTSMAVRYAQDMGLHRLDAAEHLDPVEREKRVRVWRVCQHFDIEVCYRSGKPPSINLLDVSHNNLFLDASPPYVNPSYKQMSICNEYGKLSYIRCYTYMRLFSAQIKYDSLKNIQEVVSVINEDMFRLSESIPPEARPRFYDDPQFDTLLQTFTDGRHEGEYVEMLMGFHLTYFSHIMIVNRVPWAVVSDTNDSSAHENSRFRKLSLDSARTILHIIRTFGHSKTSILSFNWLSTYPFSATTNLLSHCLNNPGDPDVVKDLSLLIDVSLNTFAKIGARADEKATRLFYIRVKLADILIRVIMRLVITIVDQTCGINILGSNPSLMEHLRMVEQKYPRFYTAVPKSAEIHKHMCSSHPGNIGKPRPILSKSSSQDNSEVYSPLNSNSIKSMSSALSNTPPPLAFSSGLGALESIDFFEFGDKLGVTPPGFDFTEATNEEYLNLPNFFFDNGL